MNSANNIKDTAHKLIDSLPDNTNWEKLVYTLQVRHDIEAGLQDAEKGDVMDSTATRSQLGITS